MKALQCSALHKNFDSLHKRYGNIDLKAIYGAGEINNPNVMLIFMNPTARNISAHQDWHGIRAPWIGTKEVWKMLNSLGIVRDSIVLRKVLDLKPGEWDEELAQELYTELAQNSIYITNIAKCTQIDARALPNATFKAYIPSMLKEIKLTNPKSIISFGNQVSSILLSKSISVSDYIDNQYESIIVGDRAFKVYPTYYPVGQGMRNMPKAIARIKSIIADQLL